MKLADLDVDEGSYFDLLGRFTNLSETALVQADLPSDGISLRISDRSSPTTTHVVSIDDIDKTDTNPDGTAVWYDTLQTAANNPAWKEDNTGYNFKLTVTDVDNLIGGHTYRAEVWVLTNTAGTRYGTLEIRVRALRSV